MILGVDVGGTNTDAVILGEDLRLVAKAKTPTTEDVSSGIAQAMTMALSASEVEPSRVRYCMLGTTQCVNAILERRGLDRVAVIRIGKPASQSIPPLFDWPDDLREAVEFDSFFIEGGNEFDGRSISELNRGELAAVAERLVGRVDSIAVTSIFSPVRIDQELEAREILRRILGKSVAVTVSHEIATIGLLERENATTLNAALRSVSTRGVKAFQASVRKLGLNASLYLGQNDGTLMNVRSALRFPILTVASGPTNSIRGAAYLGGLTNAVVVDVGGTSTDIGMLKDGFPLESARPVVIGGVRTNFRMPDVLSLALGGGSVVRDDGHVTIGPDSVGYRLQEESRVFGGDTLTVTDIAVAQGRCNLGDRSRVTEPDNLVEDADRLIHDIVESGIDKVRISPGEVPVVLVGGGGVLLKDSFASASKVIRPEHADVANAIGVAIAEVGGDLDTILTYDADSRAASLEIAVNKAKQKAIAAGADPQTTRVAYVEEIPVTYLPGKAVRVRVKACGSLNAADTGG